MASKQLYNNMFRSAMKLNNNFTNMNSKVIAKQYNMMIRRSRSISTACVLNRGKLLRQQSSSTIPCNINLHHTCNNSMLFNNIQSVRRYSTSDRSADVCSSRLSEPLKWSYVAVAGDKPLLGLTIGQVIDRAGDIYGDREAVVSLHQGVRKTFTDLQKDVSQLCFIINNCVLCDFNEFTISDLISSYLNILLI